MEGGFFSKPKGDDSHGDAGSMHSSTVATAGRPQERCVNREANFDRRRQVFPRKACRKKEAPPRQEPSVLSVLSVIRTPTAERRTAATLRRWRLRSRMPEAEQKATSVPQRRRPATSKRIEECFSRLLLRRRKSLTRRKRRRKRSCRRKTQMQTN